MKGMKKKYIQPQIEVVEVETEKMLALSIRDEKADSDAEVLSNEHRGTWGNLWGDSGW